MNFHVLNCQRITIKDYLFPGHHTCSAGLTLIFRGSLQSPEQYSSYSKCMQSAAGLIFQKMSHENADRLKILR